MKRFTALGFGLLVLSLSGSAFAAGDTSTKATRYLKANPAVVVPGGAGNYDWMMVDEKHRRLMAAHKGKGTLDILELETQKLTSVKVGECQGVAASDKYYFAGDAEESKVVILNAESLKIEGEVKVPGEIDAMGYDSKNQKLYVDHDDGTDVWVIDVPSKKISSTIHVSGVPEYVEYDDQTNKIYQNLKTSNAVAVIDASSHKIMATWSTLPAESPHGLAIDKKTSRLYSAGRNGTVVAIDMNSGKIVSSVKIPVGVDQVALDAGKKRLYCACGTKSGSVISVIDCQTAQLKVLENVPAPLSTHTLTVDPQTHAVWISYLDAKNSYLQSFEALDSE